MIPHPATLELIRQAEANGSPYAAQALAEVSLMSGVKYEFVREVRFDKIEVRIIIGPKKMPDWWVPNLEGEKKRKEEAIKAKKAAQYNQDYNDQLSQYKGPGYVVSGPSSIFTTVFGTGYGL